MKKIIFTAGLAVYAALAVQAQFVPGNLAILRAGNGTTDLVNTKKYAQTIFIDQYTTNGTWLTNTSVAVKTNGVNALVLEGGSTSEGGLTRSMDRTLLAFTGFNTNVIPGVEYDTTTAAAVPRNIGTVDDFGNYSNVVVATGDFSAQDPRYAVTDGTNNFWAVGGASGVVYLNPPGAVNESVNTSIANNRSIRIINGNLYFSSQKSTPIGIYDLVNNGQPAGLVEGFVGATNLVVAAPAGNISDFAISPDGTTVYVADQVIGVQKYTINTNTSLVTSNYSIAVASGSQPKGAFALAVDFSQTPAVIYATTEETNATSAGIQAGNHLVRIVDTGSGATFSQLSQAKTNEIFRGIDFTPDLRPFIVTQPTPTNNTVVATQPNVTITVTATSPYALSYQWQQNGTNLTDNANITGSQSNVLTFASAQLTNDGNYTVIVTNNNPSAYYAVTSSVAVLNVSAASMPSVTTQPTNQTDELGTTGSFTVVAAGAPSPTYQWYEILANGGTTNTLTDSFVNGDGETYSGSLNAMLFVSNFTTNDSGNVYYCQLTNSQGSTNSTPATLTVTLVPVSVTSQPSSVTNVTGQTVTFTVAATGSFLGYQWYFVTGGGATNLLTDGAGLYGESYSGSQSLPTLTINNVQTNDNGSYFVEVTNAISATNSLSASLDIVQIPPQSYILYTNVGAVYSQNFDSLPSPGLGFPAAGNYTNTVKAGNPVAIDGTNYSFGFSSQQFDFAAPVLPANLSGGLGLSNTMPGWFGWAQGASGSNTNYFGANAGDYTTGGIQDFGPTNDNYAGSLNRALGIQTTGSFGPAAFAARFTNATPLTLSNINLSFTGEVWRQSDLPKSLTFFYVIDSTGTNTFDTNTNDYNYLPNLNVSISTNTVFVNGTNTDVGGVPVDGTMAANQTNISVVNQVITNWPPGTVLWLVWEMTNTAGKSQGIGIDNLNFAAIAAPTVSTLGATGISSAGATFNASINPNGAATAYWFQYGTNNMFNNNTATNSLAAGSSPQAVNLPIGGLLPGTAYQYMIEATNVVGTNSDAGTNFTTTVAAAAPVAGFSGMPTNIFVTQSVTFTNTSTGSITNWSWNFNNGVLSTAAGTNVTEVYNTAGSNTVTLIVSGLGGASTNTQTNCIVVKPLPVLGDPVLASGTNFIFGGSNGVPFAQYRIFSTTNIALPFTNSWTNVFTGSFDVNGNYSYTNTPAAGKANFFRLVSP